MMPDNASATPWAADLHVTPDGRFLYASERRTSTLATFGIRQGTGLLDRFEVIATEGQPRSFALDPSGRYAFVAGETSEHLALYAIEAETGRLEFRKRPAVGKKPGWISVSRFPRPMSA